jgi:hypothetical protein
MNWYLEWESMKTIVNKSPYVAMSLAAMLTFYGCDNSDPVAERETELITDVTLVFTTDQGTAVRVTASDPDGEGGQTMAVDGAAHLSRNTTYTMKIAMINALVPPNSPTYNVSAEVTEEGDAHMFFFGWTNDLFSNPTGDGNIDGRSGAVNYTGADDSIDSKNLPLGLTTRWTTAANARSGTFRVILKHLPAIKTETTGTDVGETDLDVTFDVVVQ